MQKKNITKFECRGDGSRFHVKFDNSSGYVGHLKFTADRRISMCSYLNMLCSCSSAGKHSWMTSSVFMILLCTEPSMSVPSFISNLKQNVKYLV